MNYFDSCYLAKFYLMEPDAHRVRSVAASLGNIACCAIGWGEVIAALHRHFREKRLTFREFQLLTAQVEADVRAGLWISLPVTSALVEAQAHRMMKLTDRLFLRAADALHLTCAVENGLKEIYSSDRHLMAAAPYFGLKAINL